MTQDFPGLGGTGLEPGAVSDCLSGLSFAWQLCQLPAEGTKLGESREVFSVCREQGEAATGGPHGDQRIVGEAAAPDLLISVPFGEVCEQRPVCLQSSRFGTRSRCE